MKTQYTQNLKTDMNGDVDVDYYIAKGRRLRAEAFADSLQRIIACFKPAPAKRLSIPLRPRLWH